MCISICTKQRTTSLFLLVTDYQEITTEGEDLLSLLYHFLDEFLFLFSADTFFIARKVKILEMDKETFKIKACAYGKEFKIGKHPQGSEVKAITYSNMQVYDKPGNHEVYVIIDM